jgi:hypothetical protein
MGQRNLRSHWDRKFKHRHGTTRVGSIEQESDSYLPDADNFVFHGDSRVTIFPCTQCSLTRKIKATAGCGGKHAEVAFAMGPLASAIG